MNKRDSRKKIFVLLVSFLGIYLSFNLARGAFDSYQNASRLVGVEKRLEAAKSLNQKLKDDLKIKQSQAFIEQEARDKLGLAKPGEVAIVTPTPEASQVLAADIKLNNLTTPEKWLAVFFGN